MNSHRTCRDGFRWVLRFGFIVTNLSRPAQPVNAFYNQRSLATQPFGEMRNQIVKFFSKGRFRQLNSFIKSAGNTLTLLAVHFRIELTQVVGRFHRWKVPSNLKPS